jgi:hypothetical protein
MSLAAVLTILIVALPAALICNLTEAEQDDQTEN